MNSRRVRITSIATGTFLPLLFVFGAALAADIATEQAAIEKTVLEAMAKIELAAEHLEAGSLSDMVVPGGSVIQNGRLFASPEEAQRSIEQAYQGVEKQDINFRWQKVTVVSPTIALVTAESDSSATLVDGRTFSATSAWTVLFVLTDGQWRVLHAHTSAPPQR